MTKRQILDKHWKDFRMSIGLPFEAMSERAYEYFEKAMEEYAQQKKKRCSKP